jgi:BirA family biotin operon repressor/biotin-[acetyl-CoA-carboxylase] ligase
VCVAATVGAAMNGNAIEERLGPAARSWVREIRALDSVGSTNDVLKQAAREGAVEGTVVVAAAQTAGRGRHGRTWISPSGNLFLSILLRPADRTLLTLLPLAAGVAVAEALEAQGATCRLKWPNDVLASGRKLAGILAEASSDRAGLDAVVVGIGINVNVPHDALPEELRATAVSLRDETGRTHDLADVAAAVLAGWTVCYHALQADRRALRQAWRERSIDWWGRPVELWSGDERIVGLARDIDDSGALVLEVDGVRRAVLSGEARELRPTEAPLPPAE